MVDRLSKAGREIHPLEGKGYPLRIRTIAIPSTPSGAVSFSAFLFGLGVRRGCIHPVSRPPLIAVRSSALLFVGSFAVPVLHSSTPMLYYRSCIGLWCCRAPPLSGALCKEISVIYDGKSVARSGVLCKGISVTCNGKTQRLFWAFRNSCVTDFHFRSDKKIRVWRWVAPARSRESTPPLYIPAYAYLPAFLFAYQKRALGGYFSPRRDGGYGGEAGVPPTYHAWVAKHTRPLMTQP